MRDSPVRLTAQSAARSGLPNEVCVSAPIGTMLPFSCETTAANSSMLPGRTTREGEIPSIVTAVGAVYEGVNEFATEMKTQRHKDTEKQRKRRIEIHCLRRF